MLNFSVSLKFGVVAMLSGIMGVPFGSFLSQKLRWWDECADAHVCAAGLLLSAPTVFFALISCVYSETLCLTLVFFAEFFMNLTWALVTDILLVRKVCG